MDQLEKLLSRLEMESSRGNEYDNRPAIKEAKQAIRNYVASIESSRKRAEEDAYRNGKCWDCGRYNCGGHY